MTYERHEDTNIESLYTSNDNITDNFETVLPFSDGMPRYTC